ncbi:hypothetical protein [Nitrospira sp. Ecomares 2.1]
MQAAKVRTLVHTIISVAHVEFAPLQLEDFSKRKRVWYDPQIQWRYETTPVQVRCILVELWKLLYAHPKVLPDPARIRFMGFGPPSFNCPVLNLEKVLEGVPIERCRRYLGYGSKT